MFLPLRWRIALPYILLIVLVISGIFLFLSNLIHSNYLHSLEDEMASEAGLAGQMLALQLTTNAYPSTPDTLAREWANALGKRVTIIDPQGTVLGDSQSDYRSMENHASRPEIIQARQNGRGVVTRSSETVGVGMLYVAVPVLSHEEIIGFIRLAMPLTQIKQNVAYLQRSWAMVTGAAALIAIVLAGWIGLHATRPLQDLSDMAQQLGKGKLDVRLIPRTNDEIGALTNTINQMAAQLNDQVQALKTERSRMAAVLSGMTDGVVIVDTEGNIQLANRAAEVIFSMQADDALGQSLIQVLRDHQVYELWQSSKQTGETQQTRFEISSRRLYLQCIAIPLRQALPGSTLLLFQNLTRLRRLETVRQDFISNVSHELRTPLASLKALTETLQDGALDDPPAAHRFLNLIVTNVDALTQMVEELLELSRIESGKVPLRLSPIAPYQLITDAIQRLSPQAERAGLDVQLNCPENLPSVMADAPRLLQALVNLLHNAIKFTPRDGHIELSAELNKDQVLFKVKDTGIGISTEDTHRIFERFYKVDRARASGGTGLGLAIARHLIEAHGGEIGVESVEGHGSVFYFGIPIADPGSPSSVS